MTIFTRMFGDLSRNLLEVTTTLCSLLMISLGDVGYTYHETQSESSRVVCGVKKEYREEYSVQTMVVSTLAIFFYSYAAMRAKKDTSQ